MLPSSGCGDHRPNDEQYTGNFCVIQEAKNHTIENADRKMASSEGDNVELAGLWRL